MVFLNLIMNFVDLYQLLYEWQSLIGAIAGTVLSGLIAVCIFVFQQSYVKKKVGDDEQKELLRLVEVSVVYGIEGVCRTKHKIRLFAKRLEDFIGDIKLDSNPKSFSFSEINFNTSQPIFFDKNLVSAKIKNLYLHNKLLYANNYINEANLLSSQLEKDYDKMLVKNITHIQLLTQNKNANANEQKKQFAENLEMFAGELEKYINEFLPQLLELLLQIRLYNTSLRKDELNDKMVITADGGEQRYMEMLKQIDEQLSEQVQIEIKQIEAREQELYG